MNIKKKLLLYAFRKKNIKLISLFFNKKFKIILKDIDILDFLKFYNSNFSALLNYETNQKINTYKNFLYKLLISKSDILIDFILLRVFLFLLFINKVLLFKNKINEFIKKKYSNRHEDYLNNLNNIIFDLDLNGLNYNKFLKYNFKVSINSIYLLKIN